MKTSATVLEPQLAWAIWHGLAKLSDLLWERYPEEFAKFAKEERVRLGMNSEEDRETETPFNTRMDNPFDERARKIAWRPIEDLGRHIRGPLP